MRKILLIFVIFLFFIIITACNQEGTISESQLQTAVADTLKETSIVSTFVAELTQTQEITRSTSTPETPKFPTATITLNRSDILGRVNNPYKRSDFGGVCHGNSCFSLEILDIIRGEEANFIIAAANKYSKSPGDGISYIFIKVRINFHEGSLLNISYRDFVVYSKGQLFGLISGDAVLYRPCCTENLGYDTLELSIGTPGTSGEGWIVSRVFTDDSNPLLGYGLNFSFHPELDDGIWFELFP